MDHPDACNRVHVPSLLRHSAASEPRRDEGFSCTERRAARIRRRKANGTQNSYKPTSPGPTLPNGLGIREIRRRRGEVAACGRVQQGETRNNNAASHPPSGRRNKRVTASSTSNAQGRLPRKVATSGTTRTAAPASPVALPRQRAALLIQSEKGLHVGETDMTGVGRHQAGNACRRPTSTSERAFHAVELQRARRRYRRSEAQHPDHGKEGDYAISGMPSSKCAACHHCPHDGGQVVRQHSNIKIGKAGRNRWKGSVPAFAYRHEPGDNRTARRRQEQSVVVTGHHGAVPTKGQTHPQS